MSPTSISSSPISVTTLSPSSLLEPQFSNMMNSSVACFNTSLLQGWNRSLPLSDLYHQDLHQATVPCPTKMDRDRMVNSLVHFWNIAFTFMIITAVGGNTAVLWIVIRKFLY